MDFSKGFFPKEVVDWADPYIRRKPFAFQSFEAYMSSTVQSVSFPALSAPSVSQSFLGKRSSKRSAEWTGDLYSQSVTVTMKLLQGAFNFFAWQRTFAVWYQIYAPPDESSSMYFPGLTMRFMDEDGYVTQAVHLDQLTLTGVSDITLDYTSNVPDFKTFTVDFDYNFIKYDTEND